MAPENKKTRRAFLKALAAAALGGTGYLAGAHTCAATQHHAKCNVPCAYCSSTCQLDRGHAGNHVCANLHEWFGPRPHAPEA